MNVIPFIEKLSRDTEYSYYKGYDPYDALNSPILNFLSFRQKFLRIIWIQLLRRLPVNIRPLLLIKKDYNPKGLGLYLWGFSKLYEKDRNSQYLEKINYLIELIHKTKSTGYSGNAWGYNFDWQSRVFFVPKYTPTIVNTAFIGHALLDTFEVENNNKLLDMVVSIKDFILNDLNRTKDGNTFCFSYTPIDNIAVHNANLLGASLLIRIYKIIQDSEIKEAAYSSLAYSMKYQHDDGSWFYAETDIQKWIDSFHTGFNLQAIRYFLRSNEALEYRDAYEKGVRFYANNFFLKDGAPKYYHNEIYPLDIHSAAQAIVFFSSEGEKYKNLVESILTWLQNNMYDKNGYYYFRKGRFITNKISYIRWSQAWAFHALTEYYLYN